MLVSFNSAAYAIREFTLNLSEGGMFVPKESMCQRSKHREKCVPG